MGKNYVMILDYIVKRGDPTLAFSMTKYAILDEPDIKTICSFIGNDWLDYGTCQGCELMANRNKEDWDPLCDEDDSEVLSESYYNKLSKTFCGKNLTYDLYLKMRFASGK